MKCNYCSKDNPLAAPNKCNCPQCPNCLLTARTIGNIGLAACENSGCPVVIFRYKN